MAKAAKDRKAPSCVLCGAYNATRRTEHPAAGTYPLCKQCHEGGLEVEGSHEGLASKIHQLATRNGALPLEQRAFVGDAHEHKDGYRSGPGMTRRTR